MGSLAAGKGYLAPPLISDEHCAQAVQEQWIGIEYLDKYWIFRGKDDDIFLIHLVSGKDQSAELSLFGEIMMEILRSIGGNCRQ